MLLLLLLRPAQRRAHHRQDLWSADDQFGR